MIILPRRSGGLLLLLAACGLLSILADAFAAPPTQSRLFPAGGQRGTKVVTSSTGEFDWPVKIWAPGVEVVAGSEKGKLEVSIPADLAADRVWIRLYNEEGISAALPFLIGNLTEVIEQEPNNSPSDAQALSESATTLNGVLSGSGDVDAFAVSLRAGQTLVAAVDAHVRLGSPIDAILQVASADGIVLAENHDDVGLDPRLALTVTTSGIHIVRLFAFPSTPNRAIGFYGGADCVYRLRLTTGPFITHAVPLSVPREDPGAVDVRGWNIPPNTQVEVVSFGGASLADHPEFEVVSAQRNSPDARLGFVFAPHLGGAARVRLAPHAAVSSLTDTDADHPMRLAPPTAVTGQLRSPGAADRFQLPLQKDQRVIISVESHSLDLPVVPVVRLLDPAGTVLADAPGPGNTVEAVVVHTATQDGDYRLVVRDRYGHGGDRYVYRLTVRLQEPDFELSASADAIVVAADKPTEFEVSVTRRAAPGGSVGPITIEATDLPPGVTAAPVVSEPTGDTAAKVNLTFSTTGPAFSGPIRILGAASEPREIRRFARTPPRFASSLETIWLTAVAKP